MVLQGNLGMSKRKEIVTKMNFDLSDNLGPLELINRFYTYFLEQLFYMHQSNSAKRNNYWSFHRDWRF